MDERPWYPEPEQLRQYLTNTTSEPDPVLCDRCRCGRRATETVTCWYGCEHRECALCAQYTRMEAEEGP